MEHIPAYCNIKGCKEEARYFLNSEKIKLNKKLPFDTFYLCDDHGAGINEDGCYDFIDENCEIVSIEVGVYSCHEGCEICQ